MTGSTIVMFACQTRGARNSKEQAKSYQKRHNLYTAIYKFLNRKIYSNVHFFDNEVLPNEYWKKWHVIVCRWAAVCVWVMYTCVVPMRHKTKLIFGWLLSEDKLLCGRCVFFLGGGASEELVECKVFIHCWRDAISDYSAFHLFLTHMTYLPLYLYSSYGPSYYGLLFFRRDGKDLESWRDLRHFRCNTGNTRKIFAILCLRER